MSPDDRRPTERDRRRGSFTRRELVVRGEDADLQLATSIHRLEVRRFAGWDTCVTGDRDGHARGIGEPGTTSIVPTICLRIHWSLSNCRRRLLQNPATEPAESRICRPLRYRVE